MGFAHIQTGVRPAWGEPLGEGPKGLREFSLLWLLQDYQGNE